MTPVSPLGRYSQIGALAASFLVLAAWLVVRVAAAIQGHVPPPDGQLDTLAFGAFLLLIGQGSGFLAGRQEGQTQAAATINGMAHDVAAAHTRLDEIGAPAAAVAPAEAHP